MITHGLVVVDIDEPGGFDLTHAPTPTVRTARVWHLYFRGHVHGVHARSWGELRGSGSYVVAPPSIHETGHVYEWTVGIGEAALVPLPMTLRPAARRESAPAGERPDEAAADAASVYTREASCVAVAMRFMAGRTPSTPRVARARSAACFRAIPTATRAPGCTVRPGTLGGTSATAAARTCPSPACSRQSRAGAKLMV